MLKDLSDEALMAEYLEGDSTAFELIYARYSKKVMAYLRSKIKSSEEQDEVFQMVFMKFHKSRASYDPAYPLLQWLYVISRSVYLDYFKQTKRQSLAVEDFAAESMIHESNKLTAQSSSSEVDPELLASLDVIQREVVLQRVLDEATFDEISQKLSLSKSNVRQILSRALKRLKSTEKFSRAKR